MHLFVSWLKDSGTQAMLVLLGTVAACIAAAAAIYYGRKSLTKVDLVPLEQHTSHLEEVRTGIASVDARMKRQEDADELRDRASGVSLSVRGEADAGQPFPLYLKTTEPTVHLVRVEFVSELGNIFGKSECIPTETLFEYVARLPFQNLQEWRNAGVPVTMAGTRHGLRVYMRFDDHPITVYRRMAVTLTSTTKVVPPRTGITVYTIHGAV